jgi:hypothetical protein
MIVPDVNSNFRTIMVKEIAQEIVLFLEMSRQRMLNEKLLEKFFEKTNIKEIPFPLNYQEKGFDLDRDFH